MLEGIKIVEITTYIAAPAAGAILSDWGADVIKIESPEGCPMRHMFKHSASSPLKGSPVFELDNRGKKSLALDLAHPASAEIIGKLVAGADIFLTNIRPSALERRGLDYAGLKKHNEKLIYANITGYGLEGPERDRPGFDITAFYARSGMTHLTSRKGGEPIVPRMAIGDHITGIATAAAIMAALLRRASTGKGSHIDASLLRTGIYAMGSDMSIQLKYGRVASTKGRKEAIDPMHNYFQASDGRWFIILTRAAGGGSVDWRKLMPLIGHPELVESDQWSDARKRRAGAAEIVEMLDEAFATKTLEEWGQIFDAHDIVWAPVMPVSEVVEDTQAKATGAFTEIPEADGSGSFRSIAAPVKFAGEAAPVLRASPELGEHRDEILQSVGYSAEDIASLQEDGLFETRKR